MDEQKMNTTDLTPADSHTEDDLSLPPEITAILDTLPDEARPAVRKIMVSQSMMQMGSINSPQIELMKKMTSEHISSFLDGQREASNNQFKENLHNKIFYGILTIAFLVFVVVLVLLLKEDPGTMRETLTPIVTLIVGLIGGYGFGKSKKDE